ncbi:carbamoyltransferase HypF [Bacillus sp. 1P06AnD]|uniref:carbamoyltransferase HypF n=1 Tax=Bacillus sp. 1P06AnD TaxID=3132208 RepID=UPI0039A04181
MDPLDRRGVSVMPECIKLIVNGKVQGVGFRPFVFQLAKKLGLKGTVQNTMAGVEIILEGPVAIINDFRSRLYSEKPRLAVIEKVQATILAPKGLDAFLILESERKGSSHLQIPADAAVCEECLAEVLDPEDRRYLYPFNNCTQCGPRYTIIGELPYDRVFTSMGSFPMCPNCKAEFEDPYNRRHHAQPIACPVCGPQITLMDSAGMVMEPENPLEEVALKLRQGKIIAIKGLGGFHLCCDARNEESVQLLRKRKKRPERPLAVMSSSIGEIKRFAMVSEKEEQILASPEAPIVILSKRDEYNLSGSVAPGIGTIGAMLPYTPLHALLLQNEGLSTLIMTSANLSGLPMNYRNDEALSQLSEIADFFLMHNRDILHPIDDSVVQIMQGNIHFFRKARGYAPHPIHTDRNVNGTVGFGGQQKTTFAIGRSGQVCVSPHIGDLETIETLEHYREEFDHLAKWMGVPFGTAVIDYHPGYQSRELAKNLAFTTTLEVQHHHAHMAACLAENKVEGKAFGIILDGTGYGLDGHIWGFELFYGDCSSFDRLAHLRYTPLPGVEKCIQEPWRNAAAMLIALLGDEGIAYCEQLFPEKKVVFPILQKMAENNVNTVYAGTCGRLFDAVSAITGICLHSTYDGEAAIKLSELAASSQKASPYPYLLEKKEGRILYNFTDTLRSIVHDVQNKQHNVEISTRFHETIVHAICDSLHKLSEENPGFNRQVVLSGGSFHNRYLSERIHDVCTSLGFSVFTHKKVPCNDGGLSYGQVMIAAARKEGAKCV